MAMKPKIKVVCPACNLVVALNTNGLLPRHRPRWRTGPNRMDAPVCFGSNRTETDVKDRLEQWPAPK